MKKNPIKEKTPAELVKMLSEKREELRTLRFSAAGARAKDPSAQGKIKADIARALTELHAKTRAAAGTDQTNAKNA